MVDSVQTPPTTAPVISHYLQDIFGEDIPMAERVDWKAKSNLFLENLARDGYVISNESHQER